MNTNHSLTFLWTGWSVAISLVAVALAIGFGVWSWQRSGFRTSQGLLELLRLAIIGGCAALLNQPEWIEEFRPEELPTLAVLLDCTVSMDTRDVVRADQSPSSPISRREALAPLADLDGWAPLRDRLHVQLEPVSPEGGLAGTNLHDPLAELPDKYRHLRAVVLASDGDWNAGLPPVQAAARLRVKNIPVFVVPIGSPRRLPDVELLSVDAPTFGVAGKAVRIPFTIDSSLPREYATSVTLRTSDGDEITKDISVAPMGRTSDAVYWKPKTTGDFTVTLSVPRHAEEILPENNELSAPIAIREEKLQVLVVESYPRWEYRYLRNALSRDPGVDVSCLLFHPGLDKVGGGNQDYLKRFPDGLDELSKYDVVFLGDVGMEDGQLSAEQCRLLKGLVEHQASGLVFMPGMYGRQQSLRDTPLDELLPVVLDDAQPDGWGARTPGHVELTEAGRRSLLTKLADTEHENLDVWESLPGFQWYAGVTRAKAGTEILAVHKDMVNVHGRLPLLVTRTFGAGKVLFMGTDGAWRWRKGVEDKYHYRFWGQVVRWMAYQRNMSKGETMRMYFSQDQPQVRQSLAIHAHVMHPGGEPLSQGDVHVKITTPSGKSESIRLIAEGEEWGVFHGQFTTTEPGRHTALLSCAQTQATLESSFYVQGVAGEQIGRAARPEVLEEIARITGGQILKADRWDELIQSLKELPEPTPSIRRVQLWCHPACAGALMLMLGLFWICRKAAGLI
ncbi:MAG: hypothetical protein U0872_02805 [Planctomycetaceae bacterium]